MHLSEIFINGDDLSTKYEKILKEFSKNTGLIGTIFAKATNKIDRPFYLKQVIDIISEKKAFLENKELNLML